MFEQFVGTKPVEERHRIDTGALEKYLGLRLVRVEQFKGGQSNPTYLLTAADGRRFVLRRKPPGKLLPSAHAVDREYRVISALHSTGFPVARPHALCEDDAVIGTAFYVMDYVEGRVLWDQGLPGLSKSERFAIWDELNRGLALADPPYWAPAYGWRHHHHHHYYAPAPVVVVPAPRYVYAPPPPVVYPYYAAPAPVVVRPAPVYPAPAYVAPGVSLRFNFPL